MDFDALEKAWGKQVVVGGEVSAGAVAAEMKREVQSAERRIRGGIVLAGVVLILGWVMTIAAHVAAIKRFTPIGLLTDATMSMLYVAFFARAFHSARVLRGERAAMGGTLRESVTAALRTVELQIANARIAGYAIPSVVAISAWFFAAKYFTGDLRGFGAAMASALTVAFGAAIGAAMWHRYRKQLVPRRAELREMLHALDNESSL